MKTIASIVCVVLGVLALAVSDVGAEELEQSFSLSGVECHEGSRAVNMAVSAVDGVDRVRVLVHAKKMFVKYDPGRTSPEAIAEAVRNAPAAGRSNHYDAEPIR